MEYDALQALQLCPDDRDGDEDDEVSGHIIIIGGSQPLTAFGRPNAVVSIRAPALYSTPQIGAIYLGISPDG
jgi:hypothetical protein